MFDQQPFQPDPKATDAAVTLGLYIRDELGRRGVRMYLAALGELLPREWITTLAKRLESPLPPAPAVPPFDPNRPMPPGPVPPQPGGQKPDMEKVLQLMQLMGKLKG